MEGPALSTPSPPGAPIPSVLPTEIISTREVKVLEDLALTPPPERQHILPVSKQDDRDGQGVAKEAWKEVLNKLFLTNGKNHYVYSAEADERAKEFGISGQEFVQRALKELSEEADVTLDSSGNLTPSSKRGIHASAAIELAHKLAHIYVIADESQLAHEAMPLPDGFARKIARAHQKGEAVMLLVLKEPSETAANEIRKVSDEKFNGLMFPWGDESMLKAAGVSPALLSYMKHASVRLLCTGNNAEIGSDINELNVKLECDEGFERKHWLKMVKGISQGEKEESLKSVLKACVPMLIGAKVLEHFFPKGLHAVGGVMDDLFGAILPNVSQSMGRKELPFWQRLKEARSVLVGGAVGLAAAGALGVASSAVYGGTQGVIPHMIAGVLFAGACCAGTVGTSIAATAKAARALKQLGAKPELADSISKLSFTDKAKIVLKESIFDVPFRIGHTVIGVPSQVALGAAAGAFGFFNSGYFVAAIGAAETLFGVATAFLYPKWADKQHLRRLKSV